MRLLPRRLQCCHVQCVHLQQPQTDCMDFYIRSEVLTMHCPVQAKDFLESFGKLGAVQLLPRGPGNAADLSVQCTYATLEGTTTALRKMSDIKVPKLQP